MLHGYNPPHRYLPYLSWTEIVDLPDKENTVIAEFQRGYKIGDRLLRPAKVKVAASPDK